MPLISLRCRFRQNFPVPARKAYEWCTDFGPWDARLFPGKRKRSVRRILPDTLIMTDTTYPRGRALRIHRLVRLDPLRMAWTNTHLDGPYRYSQYWYRIFPDGPRRSHLEYHGFHLERFPRPISPAELRKRARENQAGDLEEWSERITPALKADIVVKKRSSQEVR